MQDLQSTRTQGQLVPSQLVPKLSRTLGQLVPKYRLVSVFNKNTRRFLSYDSRKQSYDQGGCVRRGVDLRLRRIMSSPSQTLRRHLVRTTATDAAVCARLDAVRRGFIVSRT